MNESGPPIWTYSMFVSLAAFSLYLPILLAMTKFNSALVLAASAHAEPDHQDAMTNAAPVTPDNDRPTTETENRRLQCTGFIRNVLILGIITSDLGDSTRRET